MEQEVARVEPPSKPKSQARRHKLKVVLALCVLVFTLSGVVVFIWLSNKPVLSRDIIESVDFPVYAPSRPPEGYTVQQQEVKADSDILSYVLREDKSDRNITVTVQPLPAGFDMAQLLDKGSVKSTDLSSGTLYNLSAGGSSQYMLETGDALVFITSPSNIDTSTINSLADSLSKQN